MGSHIFTPFFILTFFFQLSPLVLTLLDLRNIPPHENPVSQQPQFSNPNPARNQPLNPKPLPHPNPSESIEIQIHPKLLVNPSKDPQGTYQFSSRQPIRKPSEILISQQSQNSSDNPNPQQPSNTNQDTNSQQLQNPTQQPQNQSTQPFQPKPLTPSSPDSDAQQFLDTHNAARIHENEPLYTWDQKLADFARSWGNKRINDCRIVHSNAPYGENIFVANNDHWTPREAVQRWVGEEQYYDKKTFACQPGKLCGHYTQIVWRDSIRVGCARVRCANGGLFVMCNYEPPGNYKNENPFVPHNQ
ncbi:hypothetical protein ERO13_D08G146200v2 [Gossypium hirsutum]|uniref:Protein PRY1 n=1 Tax=Gossypium hirsutum TaxID=3635 RepID=A0A1U8IVU0_GOSHI|nr:protein PRY1-like [Gossypium hirsutum]KAG4134269.1 hypothetical protein ERO13_D08G146200v2 [Gossypium hirsutum]